MNIVTARTHSLWLVLCTLFCVGGASLAVAAETRAAKASSSKPSTYIVDDSATVVLDGTPEMQWRSTLPSARDNAIIGRTRVNARLRTDTWVGKQASIYMALPTVSLTGALKIQWRTQGKFQEGSLAPGGRTLLYSGTIRDARMEDVLDIFIEADGTRVTQPQQLRFHFEIDVE